MATAKQPTLEPAVYASPTARDAQTVHESSTLRVLTGITTSGTPHLGNYVGAIRPSVAASRNPKVQSFYFLADLHALIKSPEPERIRRSTLEIAASWLAAGLDPKHVVFYRQSDIVEIPELTWLLTCVTSKGLLNRAHAYKAANDRALAAGREPDVDVTAGLFMYPVLMAADILIFNAHQVPVGRDQVQHLEMTRDIAQRFNALYGSHFTLPEAVIDADVATLPGLDGRKMSKSYDNTVPLFASREDLQKAIAAIVTDSRAPGEPKDPAGSAIFQIFQAFASPDETAEMRRAFASGVAWRDAKGMLFERIDRDVGSMRTRYRELIAKPEAIEHILVEGAVKARALAGPFLARLRAAVGLRRLGAAGMDRVASKVSVSPVGASARKVSVPIFKQYRERDGRFHFKLIEPQGRVLLQSVGFASPQEAGQAVAVLRERGAAGLDSLRAAITPQPGVADDEILAALARMAD